VTEHRQSNSRADVACSKVQHDDVGKDEIDIVVAHIRRLVRTASLEFALRVGGLIIHHFYDGDTNAWRSRGPKISSFRRLAQHPGLPLSPGGLYRCVALFELCERLNAPTRWEHLSASHLRLVIGLPAPTQERILATANTQRWSVKALQKAVLLEKSSRHSRGGRRAQPPLARTLTSIKKSCDEYQEALGTLEHLSVEELETSMVLLEETQACLERIAQSIRATARRSQEGWTLSNDNKRA
jgi:hypothetical protein